MNGIINHAWAPEKRHHVTWESSKTLFPFIPKWKRAAVEVIGSCRKHWCIGFFILMVLLTMLPYRMLGGAFSIAKVVSEKKIKWAKTPARSRETRSEQKREWKASTNASKNASENASMKRAKTREKTLASSEWKREWATGKYAGKMHARSRQKREQVASEKASRKRAETRPRSF